MRFRMGRKRVLARPGDVVVVPPGMPHGFANAGAEPALVRVNIRPALRMEQLFETAVGLAEQGRTMMKGIPRPLDLGLFTRSSSTRCRLRSCRSGSSASRSHRSRGSPSAADARRALLFRERAAGMEPLNGAFRSRIAVGTGVFTRLPRRPTLAYGQGPFSKAELPSSAANAVPISSAGVVSGRRSSSVSSGSVRTSPSRR